MTTSRSDISKEITNPPDIGFWDMLEQTSPKGGKRKGYQTGAGMDFTSKKKKKKKKKVEEREVYKGGKIMVGYKAGGKV